MTNFARNYYLTISLKHPRCNNVGMIWFFGLFLFHRHSFLCLRLKCSSCSWFGRFSPRKHPFASLVLRQSFLVASGRPKIRSWFRPWWSPSLLMMVTDVIIVGVCCWAGNCCHLKSLLIVPNFLFTTNVLFWAFFHRDRLSGGRLRGHTKPS